MNKPLDIRRSGSEALPARYIPVPVNPYDAPLPKSLRRRVKDFFIYTVEFVPLALSATASDSVSTNIDADFLIVEGVRVVTAVDNTTVLAFPPFLVTISDSGSGRKMMDRAVHIENLFGTAQLPAVWPRPKIIPAGSAISVDIQNLAATPYNVRLSFRGFKIFSMKEE